MWPKNVGQSDSVTILAELAAIEPTLTKIDIGAVVAILGELAPLVYTESRALQQRAINEVASRCKIEPTEL